MEIVIHGNNIEVTEGIKEHIHQKLKSVKMFEKSQRIEIRLETQKKDNIANVNLHFYGKDIHIQQKADDMYEAIDLLINRLKTNVVKNKEKHDCHLTKN